MPTSRLSCWKIIGQHSLRPVEYENGGNGTLQLSQPAYVSDCGSGEDPRASSALDDCQKPGFAIASEESRYTLNGALMVLQAGINHHGRDRRPPAGAHRTQRRKVAGVSGEMKTLVPKKAMDELKSLLDSTDAEEIEFAKERINAILPHRPAAADLTPTHRPVFPTSKPCSRKTTTKASPCTGKS